jgi:sortase A
VSSEESAPSRSPAGEGPPSAGESGPGDLQPAHADGRPGPGAGREASSRYLVRTTCLSLALFALVFAFSLVILSAVAHRAAQTRLFDRFRNQLALGVAPVGPTDANGRLLRPGTPVALLEIPRIGVHEVVVEGTTSAVLMTGPGHLRSTVMPGQPGTSVIFGRAAAFGGPFRNIDRLRRGDVISAVTGAGTSTFKVIDQRRPGDPVPAPLQQGGSRLTLVTASGRPFMPSGLLWVDADLAGSPLPSSTGGLTSVPPSERALGHDTSDLWVLVLELQLLTVAVVGAVVCWRRWGRAQTWVVFAPLMLLLTYAISTQVARLLPNLM